MKARDKFRNESGIPSFSDRCKSLLHSSHKVDMSVWVDELKPKLMKPTFVQKNRVEKSSSFSLPISLFND